MDFWERSLSFKCDSYCHAGGEKPYLYKLLLLTTAYTQLVDDDMYVLCLTYHDCTEAVRSG